MRKLARCKIYRFFGAKLKYELIEIYFTRLRTLGVDTGETFFWQLSGKFNCRDIFVKINYEILSDNFLDKWESYKPAIYFKFTKYAKNIWVVHKNLMEWGKLL